MIILNIPGTPVPWSAPKTSGKIHYDIRSEDKKRIRKIMLHQIREQGLFNPLEGAVSVDMVFVFEPPKSTSKEKRQLMLSGHMQHTSRPDASNCYKLAEDCLQSVGCFKNDSSNVLATSRKIYGDQAKTLIFIRQVDWVGISQQTYCSAAKS